MLYSLQFSVDSGQSGMILLCQRVTLGTAIQNLGRGILLYVRKLAKPSRESINPYSFKTNRKTQGMEANHG
jgi:hypothetical protein